jgi:amino acid permease
MDLYLNYSEGKTSAELESEQLLDQDVRPETIYSHNIWTFAIFIMAILTMLAWVRNIATFRFTFLFANILLVTMVVIVCCYSVKEVYSNGHLGPDITLINTSGMWTALGFSIYTFEGIGILMPCMAACECPDQFEEIWIYAVLTVIGAFFLYGSTSYLAYGNMKEQMVTQLLPKDDFLVKLLILFMVLVLMFTYPLTINPANNVFESYTLDKIFPPKKKHEGDLEEEKTFWQRNGKNLTRKFSRFMICLSAAYLGISLASVLDKFIGLLGAVFCAPLAMILPTLCHLKLLANTRQEKVKDIVIICASLFVMVVCIVQTVSDEFM